MQFNKYLKWTAIGALCAALFTPLIVSYSLFFPFIVGKSLFFKAMTEIALGAWLLLALRDSAYRPRMSALFWSFVAFTGIVLLADVFGQNPWKSIWSNFERMEGFITIAHFFAYFFVASLVLNTERIWKRFLEVSLISSAIVSVYALFQMWGWVSASSGGARLDGTLGNATYLAVCMLFSIFIAALCIYRESVVWKRAVIAIIGLLNTYILFQTGTRGAILGLLGGFLITGLLAVCFNWRNRKVRIVSMSMLGVILVLVLGFMSIRNSSFVRESNTLGRFASLSFSDAKNQARYYIWPMAIEGWKEKPILGWGQENFNYVFNAHYNPKLYGQEQWFDRAHNAPLDWLIAGGALGFLGYLALFVSALWVMWRRSPHLSFMEKGLLTGLLAAYLFNNLFVFDNTTSYIMFAVILALVHFHGTRLSKPVAPEAEEFDGADARTAAFLVIALLAGGLYAFVWRPYQASHSLLDALKDLNTQPISVDNAIMHYQEALSYGMVGNGETIERMVESVSAINGSNASLEVKQKYYDLVKSTIDDRLARLPGDARYELFAGSFYSSYGQSAQAEDHFKKAVALSPGKQTMYFLLGSQYIQDKDYANAEAAFKTAYELDTENNDAAEYYAASLIYVGKESEAITFMTERGDSMTSDIFVRAYADLNQWSRAIAILQKRVDANPSNIQAYQDLAVGYYQSGQRAKAIEVFQNMEKIFPQYSSQAEQYISQIRSEL